jgi:hypothetical protein
MTHILVLESHRDTCPSEPLPVRQPGQYTTGEKYSIPSYYQNIESSRLRYDKYISTRPPNSKTQTEPSKPQYLVENTLPRSNETPDQPLTKARPMARNRGTEARLPKPEHKPVHLITDNIFLGNFLGAWLKSQTPLLRPCSAGSALAQPQAPHPVFNNPPHLLCTNVGMRLE